MTALDRFLGVVQHCAWCDEYVPSGMGPLCGACIERDRPATDPEGQPVCSECGCEMEEYGVVCEVCLTSYKCPRCGGPTDDKLMLCESCDRAHMAERARGIDGPATGKLPLAHETVGR